jgi:hypothetical protein
MIAAIRAALPAETAQAIEADEAYGALVYRLRQHATHHDTTPAAVLAQLNDNDLHFANQATNPAAFLAAKIRNCADRQRKRPAMTALPRALTACAEGCYKHYNKTTGTWVCCKCGT